MGIKDHIAKPFNADRMALVLRQIGANIERVNINTGHVGMIMSLTQTLQPHYPTYGIILDYLQRRLNDSSHL